MPNFPISSILQFSAEEEEIVLGRSSKWYGSFPGEAEFRLGFLSLKGIVLSKSPVWRAWPPAQAEQRCTARVAPTGRRLPVCSLALLYWIN